MDFITSLINSMPGTIAQGLIWGIMAIGVYITYRVLDLADLTVDGSIATGGAVCVILINNGFNIPFALLCATIAGIVTGLVTGLLHTLLGIPAILAGILCQLSLYSINLKILGGANVSFSLFSFKLVSTEKASLGPFYQNSIFILALFVIGIIGLLYWFFGTELGASLRATGSNANMSRAQGINTSVMKVLGLMLSNGIVALSGGLLAQFQGGADVKMGSGAIVIGLAAVIIGEVLLKKILRNFALRLAAVTVGGIVYYIIFSIISQLGIDGELLKALSAVVVAIFLGIPYLKSRFSRPTLKIAAKEDSTDA